MRTILSKVALILALSIAFSTPSFADLTTGDAILDRYDSFFEAAGAENGFDDARYLKTLAWWESNESLDPNAVSDDSPCGGSGPESKSTGIFQITPACGEGEGHTAEELKDPELNIKLGVKHLAEIRDDMRAAHPGCTEEEYLKMMGWGWVQSYDTITGCGVTSDERQTAYSDTIAEQYAKWYGNDKPDVVIDNKITDPGKNGEASKKERIKKYAKRNGNEKPIVVIDDEITEPEDDEEVQDVERIRKMPIGEWDNNEKCSEATGEEKEAFCVAAGWPESCNLDFSTKCDAGGTSEKDTPESSKETKVEVNPDKGKLIYSDEFDGTTLGDEWQVFDAWGSGTWRDATYDDKHIKLEDGKLTLTGEVDANGNFVTSYLQAYDANDKDGENAAKFGPGTIVEFSADMSGCGKVGSGSWCAGWLYDPTDAYDGNTANGTEIDIAEYTKANEWASTQYSANNHYDTTTQSGSAGTWVDAVDPSKPGFHTYAVDWQKDSITWSVDGQDVYKVTEGVSGSDNQAMILSIENAIGGNSPWAEGTSNNSDAEMVVDWVRAYSTE